MPSLGDCCSCFGLRNRVKRKVLSPPAPLSGPPSRVSQPEINIWWPRQPPLLYLVSRIHIMRIQTLPKIRLEQRANTTATKSGSTPIGPRNTQTTRFHGLARQITKRGASSGFQFTVSVLRFGSEMGQNGPYSSVYRPSQITPEKS